MITVKDVKQRADLKQLTDLNESGQVKGAYICDLLSWVMAKGQEGMVWITVQTHLNVLAVAVLHEFSCIIIPENIEVPDETVAKAQEEGIPVYSTSKDGYELCCLLNELGVGK